MSDSPLIEHGVKLFRTLVKSFIASGHYDLARDLIAELRVACDELTADVNEAAKGKWAR